MNWLPLGLICAFSLAAADGLTKRYFAGCSGLQLVFVRLGPATILLLPVALIYPISPVPAVFWWWMVVLVPLEIIAMWLYMLAIRDSPLHLTLPYLAFTPVFNVVTGYVVLGEMVSSRGLCGIVLVMTGGWLLHCGKVRGFKDWMIPLAAVFRERGSRLMLMVACIYSLTSVISKEAMQYVTPERFGPFYFALIGVVFIFVGLLVNGPGNVKIKGNRWALLGVGVCMAVMIVSHFIAIDRVEVAYFISLKRSSLLFGIVFGYLFFHERNVVRHLLAGVVMLAGMTMVVLS